MTDRTLTHANPTPAPKMALHAAPASLVQRKCACGGKAGLDGECEECRKNQLSSSKASLQRTAAGNSGNSTGISASVYNVIGSGGQPLDSATRSYMEPRFGHDFSQVRVHTDSQAAESARAVDALAYTVGQHIVFDRGQYHPNTPHGQNLLAHELAHTIQQAGVQRVAADSLGYSSPGYAALEREADQAAAAVMNAPAPIPALAQPIAPHRGEAVVSRVARSWTPLATPLAITGHQVTDRAQLDPNETNPRTLAFKVNKFILPREKGPVEALYKSRATAQALEATISFVRNNADSTPYAGLWQSRASTANLRDNWLVKVGWNRLSNTEVANRWHQAGGNAPTAGGFPAVNPRVATSACDMDHIVELQLGGTNVPENLQVLNAAENQGSGRAIWEQVRDLATGIRDTLPDPKPAEIILAFADAEQVGGAVTCSPASGPGAAATCTEAECSAQNAAPAATGGAPTGEAYSVEAGGSTVTFQANPSPANTDLLNSSPENQAAAELIPGIILSQLNRPRSGSDTINAFIESSAYFKRSRATRVPLALQSGAAALTFNVLNTNGRRTLRLNGSQRPSVGFTYPYLSTGTLNLSFDPATGLSGTGTLTPSIPLLNRAPLNVEFGPNRLRFFYGSTRGLQSPIPGLRFTEATLGIDILPEFRPVGRMGFAVGPSGRNLITGTLEASGDANGLVFDGILLANIPNTDEARGEVHYRNHQWSGFVVVSSSQIRFPGVQGGEIRVDFTNSGIEPSGTVNLLIANQPVDLSARYRNGQIIFTGRGTFSLPGLNPLTATVETNGSYINFEGTTGVTLRYMSGTITVRYRSGAWSGDGTVTVTAGRANGTANIHLNEAGRVYGDGRLTYRITDRLTAGMGIVLREDRSVRVSGDITLGTIQLFDRFPRSGGRTRLFRTHFGIPILGFSLGPVGDIGLVLAIDPEIGVYYGIGPGELRNTRITTAFDPFAENPNLEFTAGAQIYIPFDAGFYITIPAALSLSAVIASVSAGLEATADIGVRGSFEAGTEVTYRTQIWTVTALAGLYVNPRLALRVDGFLRAAAGFGPFETTAEKRWNLRSWEWGSNLRFGVEFPFRYASNEPFNAPSFDDIRFVYPENINFRQMLSDVIDQAS